MTCGDAPKSWLMATQVIATVSSLLLASSKRTLDRMTVAGVARREKGTQDQTRIWNVQEQWAGTCAAEKGTH